MSDSAATLADPAVPVGDDRPVSLGLGRVVMALFWVMAVVSVLSGTWYLIRESAVPIGPRLIAFLAGFVYLAVALGLTHNGRKMRLVAGGGLIISLVAPIIMGLLELGMPATLPSVPSPWANFGADYYYLPLILSVVGLVWMWLSDPRRIVEIAEGVERPSRLSAR